MQGLSGIILETNLAGGGGTGATKPTKDYHHKVVQVVVGPDAQSNPWSGTINVEGSVDGNNYEVVQNGGPLTGDAIFDVPRWYSAMRVVISSYTAGTITVTLGGFDMRAM